MAIPSPWSQDESESLESVLAIARAVGWGAADILQSYYQGDPNIGNLEIQDKKGDPVTNADIAVNHYILDNLQACFGSQDCAYLSEETYQSNSPALTHPWVWIIDPLDGTRDFIERTGEYAVHIALTYEGRPVLAVVVWPEAGKLYYALRGKGAFVETRDRNVRQVQVSSRSRLEDLAIVVSRSHRDGRFNHLLEHLPCQNQKYVGSVGCKIATIVEQDADVYISLSGKSAPKDWDMAAPELILTEAGGQFTYLDGSPLVYNKGDVNQWGCLIASNSHCHASLLTEVEKILLSTPTSN